MKEITSRSIKQGLVLMSRDGSLTLPADPRFVFADFYDRLAERGYLIYPGKLTVAESFRIGCIGRIGAAEMRGALEAIRAVLTQMGVADGRPPQQEAFS